MANTASDIHQLIRDTIAHLLTEANGKNSNPGGGLEPKTQLIEAAAALLNTTAGQNAASGSFSQK